MTARNMTLPDAGDYEVDTSTSTIEFRTRHMFGMAPVNGSFRLTSGHLRITDPPGRSEIEAAASAASFSTGNDKRDDHVRSADFLDVEQHQQLTFRSTDVSFQDGAWAVRGVLNAHGQDGPLTLNLDGVERNGPRNITIRASGALDRRTHGITTMPLMAGNRLTLALTVRATLNAA